MMQFIIFQLVAHLLADFVFQPQKWSNIKSTKIITWHHIYHVLIVFVFSYGLSFDVLYWKWALLLTALHLLVDVVKSYLQIQSKKRGQKVNYFFIDQFVHILVFTLISAFYWQSHPLQFLNGISIKYIVGIAAFVLSAKPINIIIKNIFIAFSIETPSDQDVQKEDDDISLPNAGKLIGIMERFLVLALVIVGQYGAVGLIIAAKSILRYKSMQKNEYFLVGTLLSFGIAVLLGIIVVNIEAL